MKAAAAKLKLAKVEDWVEHELNGYLGTELPAYRRLYGRPHAFNPYNGWIPIIMNSDRDNDLLSRCDTRQSLSSLEDLIARATAGHVEMPFPPSVIRMLNRDMDVEFGRMANHVAVSQIQGIIDAVRNQVLDWALELERAGIHGEGYSFNDDEKHRAKKGAVTYNINSIGTFAGNMGTGNKSGDILVTVTTTSQIAEIVEKIRAHVPDLEAAGADGPRLVHALEAISDESGNPQPDGGKMKSLFGDAKEALIGAAGNLTAEGAKALIAAALKLLGG